MEGKCADIMVSTLDWVRALTGVIVLCSWTFGQDTLLSKCSPLRCDYKMETGELLGAIEPDKMPRVSCKYGLESSIQSKVMSQMRPDRVQRECNINFFVIPDSLI